ncbi:uncharacterized protein [Equus caballus]|uniref:uncharacterized protein n=1 Tax=Equus caballus TaxID=9796 RepID=UPI0038B3EB79
MAAGGRPALWASLRASAGSPECSAWPLCYWQTESFVCCLAELRRFPTGSPDAPLKVPPPRSSPRSPAIPSPPGRAMAAGGRPALWASLRASAGSPECSAWPLCYWQTESFVCCLAELRRFPTGSPDSPLKVPPPRSSPRSPAIPSPPGRASLWDPPGAPSTRLGLPANGGERLSPRAQVCNSKVSLCV